MEHAVRQNVSRDDVSRRRLLRVVLRLVAAVFAGTFPHKRPRDGAGVQLQLRTHHRGDRRPANRHVDGPLQTGHATIRRDSVWRLSPGVQYDEPDLYHRDGTDLARPGYKRQTIAGVIA